MSRYDVAILSFNAILLMECCLVCLNLAIWNQRFTRCNFEGCSKASNLNTHSKKFFIYVIANCYYFTAYCCGHQTGCWRPRCCCLAKPVKAISNVTRLCFQYLAIYSNGNQPNSIQNVPKRYKNFALYKINPYYVANDFKIFAKVVEFHRIWSHWVGVGLQKNYYYYLLGRFPDRIF